MNYTERSQADMIAGLRALADHLESHPLSVGRFAPQSVYVFVDNAEEMAVAASEFGTAKKCFDGNYHSLQKVFSDNVSMSINAEQRLICTRVKVGTNVIPAKPEIVLPATEETVEEVYEWKCPESLLKPKQSADTESMEAESVPSL